MIRFLVYFVIFLLLFRLLRGVLSFLFRAQNGNRVKNDVSQKKSKYENIEEAKYTEIKSDNAKEKLNCDGK